MSTHLPPEVLAGLRKAQLASKKSKARWRVRVDDQVFPILEMSQSEFAMASEATPALRGLVDIYDGSRYVSQCLIMHAREEDDMRVYEFKWNTEVRRTPALDFAREKPAIAGYLTAG